ncbi:MAG: tRNA (adenosine(37)-N6)-threonylcarbamoyltransferase complex transferase subunit TsaD [Desulfovibrio sp.]|nr:tRNA (adenosine(37)-N6)-threonylcarbamoyltransferase complex transferase subunit TsaD [Desulfovibrio sp.]
MLCLGIETSCDETALALVRDGEPAGSVLVSQADIHTLFGGVVPELASREHCRYIGPLFDELVRRSGIKPGEIDVVSVARGPGLLGSLLVGVAFAKALALGLEAKFLGVNHLHAHLLAAGIEHDFDFPVLGLLVSGGHTHLYRIQGITDFKQMGKTLDDAAGEAFDKVGKMLGLPYPCGGIMNALAVAGAADPHLFPRPCVRNDSLDFSFSGLKTAALNFLGRYPELLESARHIESPAQAPDILKNFCASFNLAVVDTICAKTHRALDACPDLHTLLFAGGVASNTLLREDLSELMRGREGRALSPSPALCTDNAVMIAYAAWLLAEKKFRHSLRMESIPRGRPIPNDMIAEKRRGAA